MHAAAGPTQETPRRQPDSDFRAGPSSRAPGHDCRGQLEVSVPVYHVSVRLGQTRDGHAPGRPPRKMDWLKEARRPGAAHGSQLAPRPDGRRPARPVCPPRSQVASGAVITDSGSESDGLGRPLRTRLARGLSGCEVTARSRCPARDVAFRAEDERGFECDAWMPQTHADTLHRARPQARRIAAPTAGAGPSHTTTASHLPPDSEGPAAPVPRPPRARFGRADAGPGQAGVKWG
jgi:hypothetical protein